MTTGCNRGLTYGPILFCGNNIVEVKPYACDVYGKVHQNRIRLPGPVD